LPPQCRAARGRAAPPSPADPVAIVDTKKLDANKAVIAVTITGQGAPRARADDGTIRYNFTRDDGQWKIDDISGASDGEPWSIRAMLAASAGN
jgi:hypothetical protein